MRTKNHTVIYQSSQTGGLDITFPQLSHYILPVETEIIIFGFRLHYHCIYLERHQNVLDLRWTGTFRAARAGANFQTQNRKNELQEEW
jgi:hypothetical protein